MNLEHEERLGLIIICLFHSGLLKNEIYPDDFTVELTTRLPEKYWNEFDYVVDMNTIMDFIPNNIFEFIDRYDYYKTFTGANAPSYEDVNPKFWSSVKLYERIMSDLREVPKEETKQNMSPDAALNLFKK